MTPKKLLQKLFQKTIRESNAELTTLKKRLQQLEQKRVFNNKASLQNREKAEKRASFAG
jgi:hypothetical protein